MAQIKQIFIPLSGVPCDDTGLYYERAGEIFEQIKGGEPFDRYSDVFLAGKAESIGSIIFDLFVRGDIKKVKLLGDDFINTVLSIKERKISGVLTSKRGLHIVAVIKRYPCRTLKKDDLIPPHCIDTVRERIDYFIKNEKRKRLYRATYNSMCAELKGKATIIIYHDLVE